MHAYGDVLRRIAAASGGPLSETLQVARRLSEAGLYDRPGPGRRRVREPISLSSLVNVALGLAGQGLLVAGENVRILRGLVPQGGIIADIPLPEPSVPAFGYTPLDYTIDQLAEGPLLPGATLADAFEGLIERTATGAKQPIVHFRQGLAIMIRTSPVPVAMTVLCLPPPPERPGAPGGFWSTSYMPAQAALIAPRPPGIDRPGVIRFALIEVLAEIWRERLETSRIFGDGSQRPVRDEAATTPARAVAANPEATPEACPKALGYDTRRERELKAAV